MVAVLAVVATIPLLRNQMEPEPEEAPPEPAPTVVAPDIGKINAPIVYDMDFLDEQHGFALWGRCTDGRDYRCERRLLVTEDGVNWSSHGFEPTTLATPRQLAGRIAVLGPGRLLLTDSNNRGASRYFSGDNGKTWTMVTSMPAQTVAEIPPDAILETRCFERVNSQCTQRRVVATLPDSGQRAWLANPPAISDPVPEQRAMRDGSWWVSGKDPATGRWAVATSRDRGRTWATSVLPAQPDAVFDGLTIAASGQTAYVLATGTLPDGLEPRSLVAIFQSLDGGAGWTQTWRGTGRPPRTLGGSAVIRPDGGLFVALDDVGPTYLSLDGGRTFVPMFNGPRLTSVRRTTAGYLAMASETSPPTRYFTSVDGVGWTGVPLP